MDSFRRAGEAMLLAQEGQREIALVLWKGLGALARRMGGGLAALLNTTPGPYRLD